MIIKSKNKYVNAFYNFNPPSLQLPFAWLANLEEPKGTTRLNACAVLSEIVFFYTPKINMDGNGNIVMEERFHADLLQKSYDQLSVVFGLTKLQCKNAIIFLEKCGYLKRIFRTVDTPNGQLGNVMYIEVNPDRIMELSTTKSGSKQSKSLSYYPMNTHVHRYEHDNNFDTPMDTHMHTYEHTCTEGYEHVCSDITQNTYYTQTHTHNTNPPISPQGDSSANASLSFFGEEKEKEEEKEKSGVAAPKEKKKTTKEIFQDFTQNTELLSSLLDFDKHRKEIGKPIKETSASAFCKKLRKDFSSDQEIIDALENSIANGWQGVFPPKGVKTAGTANKETQHFEMKTDYDPEPGVNIEDYPLRDEWNKPFRMIPSEEFDGMRRQYTNGKHRMDYLNSKKSFEALFKFRPDEEQLLTWEYKKEVIRQQEEEKNK